MALGLILCGNADCADEDLFITDPDLWNSFDEAFLDVNEEVTINDEYAGLMQSVDRRVV